MDVKLTCYKSTQALLDKKACFKETICDVPDGFGYENLVKAFKSVFGVKSIIEFYFV